MKHGISELEWNDYLDGRAAAEVRDRIEAHLVGCLQCWEFYEQLSGATEELLAAGEQARQALTLEDPQLHAMLRGVFSKVKTGESGSRVQGQLNVLETVLATFFGTQTAISALHAAARNSPARSLDQVTPDNWEPFLERLATIAGAMCGSTFAGLVRERGQF